MIDDVKKQLTGYYPAELIDKMLSSYEELVGNFVRGKTRPSQVEGGRFCESVIRLLQYETTGSYTSVGISLNLDSAINALEKLPKGSFDDSIRIHIPRTVRVIYDIRNKRDSAHLGAVVTNQMDATLVLNCCRWIMAELFRLKSKLPITDAQKIIDNLVEKQIPLIQNFGGFPVILKPELAVRDRILLLLYNKGVFGATRAELLQWLPPKMHTQVANNLSRLQHDKSYIHRDDLKVYITWLGEKYVEENILPILSIPLPKN